MAVVMGVSVVDRLLMRMRIATGMPSGMHDRALLREEQQSNAEIVENPPGHYLGKDAEAASIQRGLSPRLLGNGQHRVGQPIVKPHRVVFQHGEFAGEQYRLKAIFDRRLGLHFNHLLRSAGQTERA